MQFGATLRLLRLESGLSLRDLARRLDVSSAYISRVENGLDAPPTAARLLAIARELRVPPQLLLELAQRVNPFVADYVEQVPEAGALFLEIAHRRLQPGQLAQLRQHLDQRFPLAAGSAPAAAPCLAELLAPERVVLGLGCTGMEDVLDVAAERLAAASRLDALPIAADLKRRESELSSAIGSGVAVPCDWNGTAEPIAALLTLERPLVHDTPDGKPLQLVIVLSGPRNSPGRRLLLARLARLTAGGLADALAGFDAPARAIARLRELESARD